MTTNNETTISKNEPVYRSEHRARYMIILLAAIVVAACSGTFLFYNTLGAAAPPEFITLNETNKVTFRAYLTDERPFGKSYLDRTSDTIPMSILEYISLETDYRADISNKADIDFYGSATVTLTATQNKGTGSAENGPVILNRTFPLCFNNETMEDPEICPDGSGGVDVGRIDGSTYLHTRVYSLYLQPYIDFINTTTASYVDYPINSNITIDFQISATNNDKLHSSMKRTVSIPLAEDNTKLALIGDEEQSKDFYGPERSMAEIILLVAFGAFAVIGIGVAMGMAKKLLNKKSPYRQEIDGYLNDYSDAIVKTVTPPELKSHPEQIAVESFKELLGLAVSISDPIMFFETDTLSIFYITRDTIIYYFIIPNPRFYRNNAPVETIEAAILPSPSKKIRRRKAKKVKSK